MELLEGVLDVDDLDGLIATLEGIASAHDVTIQAFDARYVAGPRHLERAVELADRAIARDENVARDRAVEILLYAAGRRQIDRALEMGVNEGETRVVILIDAGGETGEDGVRENDGDEIGAVEAIQSTLELEAEPTTAEPDEATLQTFFEITDTEREATDATLEELVRERVALLEVEK